MTLQMLHYQTFILLLRAFVLCTYLDISKFFGKLTFQVMQNRKIYARHDIEKRKALFVKLHIPNANFSGYI